MIRRRAPALLLFAIACGDTEVTPNVHVAASFTAPRALLDKVTALTITVYEGATCDDTTGATTKDMAKQVAQQQLGTTGCPPTAKFCGSLNVAESDASRVFEAVGKNGDATIATGCTTATVNQDSLALNIKMFRFLAPAMCGDNIVEPTEQCEPGNTPVCDAKCQSTEIFLSQGSTQNGTATMYAPGDKTDPFFLWPTGTGQGGWFFAFYTDQKTSIAGSDVAMRVMNDDLTPLTMSPAPVAFTFGALFLPNGSNGKMLPPQPDVKSQGVPAAALAGGKIFVTFQDDNASTQDIHLRSMDASGVTDQSTTALGINGTNGAGEPGIQGAPAIAAGPGGNLYIAWVDSTAGKIAGRTLAPASTLGAQNDVSTGNGNSHVALAATSTGWIAVWQSGSSIKLRALGTDGTPAGAEQTVNQGSANAEAPAIAALADGRFAVAWSGGGDVFVQRFDDKGGPIAGDQAAPINDVVKDGTQNAVAIGATTASGGSYVVAWLDASTGNVRARNLGGSAGFLFNNVDGQASEYQASRAAMHTRAHPVVASGGSAPFVAIGWEDQTAGSPGIYARRFPLPSE